MNDDEVDNVWSEGFDSGYRRGIEFIKKLIEKDELDSNTVVEKMMKDWLNS